MFLVFIYNIPGFINNWKNNRLQMFLWNFGEIILFRKLRETQKNKILKN